MFGLKPRTVYYWYKEHLSGYRQARASGECGGKAIRIVDEQSGEVLAEKDVPIIKAANMGANMTIDEKQIGKTMYTVMTNADTGKLALIAQTLKPDELQQVIDNYLPSEAQKVRSVSCDMSPSYKKFSRQAFPEAELIIDKFHVVKHVLDALQQVRKQLKTQCLNSDATLTLPEKEQPVWTEIELLERSRYILCKMQPEWNEDEKLMMDHLFQNYPILQKAYELTQKLRQWYHRKNIGRHTDFIERDLDNWCDDVLQSKIPAFRAVRKMIEKHQPDIINYFKKGQTNAKAENMNGKIQRFIANNFGIKDRDFFFYRLAGYFS
jgi:transposase